MKRNIRFSDDGWNSYTWWQGQDDTALKRVKDLIDAAAQTPFEGIGKPEPLTGNLAGFWSRRIDDANRLVYAADEVDLTVISCRYHYGD